jgi:hypothetical protein
MHPRTTRGCPLVILKEKKYKLFINDVNSPGFLKTSRLKMDAVTCQHQSGTTCIKVENISFGVLSSNFGMEGPITMAVLIQWMPCSSS